MSKRDWFFVFALGGCLTLACELALSQSDTSADRGNNTQQTQEQQQPPNQPGTLPATQNPDAVAVTQEQKPQSPDYKSACGDTKDHNEADLCEQRRMAQAALDAVWWARFQTILGICGFVAVLCSLGFTGWAAWAAACAARAAQASVAVTSESAHRQLRAYVSKKAVAFKPIGPTDSNVVHSYNIGVIWENTGTTPAIGVKLGLNAKSFVGGLPANFGYDDQGATRKWGTVIGPTQTAESTAPFTAEELWQLEMRPNEKLYLWGWIEYSDVFKNSPRRRSEFCFQVITQGDARRDGATLSHVNFGPFNGMDESCYRQPTTKP